MYSFVKSAKFTLVDCDCSLCSYVCLESRCYHWRWALSCAGCAQSVIGESSINYSQLLKVESNAIEARNYFSTPLVQITTFSKYDLLNNWAYRVSGSVLSIPQGMNYIFYTGRHSIAFASLSGIVLPTGREYSSVINHSTHAIDNKYHWQLLVPSWS